MDHLDFVLDRSGLSFDAIYELREQMKKEPSKRPSIRLKIGVEMDKIIEALCKTPTSEVNDPSESENDDSPE